MKKHGVVVLVAGCLIATLSACGEPDAQREETPDWQAAIEQALPDRPVVQPAQARSLLIFNLAKGYVHASIEWVDFAIARMGEKSGAFTAVVSSDVQGGACPPGQFRRGNRC